MTQLFSLSQLAEEIGISRQTLAKRLADLPPAQVDRGAHRYHLSDVLPLVLEDLLRVHHVSTDESFDEARRRREFALAQIAELDLAQRRGEVIDASEVENTWATVIVNVRSRLLSLPTKAAPMLQGVTGLAETNEVLKGLVYEALRELSDSNFYLPEPDDEPA